MFVIKPLHTLSRAEVRELAVASADRGDPIDTANLFDPGTERHSWFQTEYSHRQGELQPA